MDKMFLDAIRQLPKPPPDAQWSGCAYGHDSHKTRDVLVDLCNPIIKDMATVNERLAPEPFWFGVWAWDDPTFSTFDKYCPQQDAVSWSIENHGIWEPFETALVLDILSQPRKPGAIVVDIGSQIGWYSTLAVLRGFETVAIEADEDCLDMTRENVQTQKPFHQELLTPIHGYVGADAPVLPPTPIHFLKVDIEGFEPYAFDMLTESFRLGTIDYALIEVSPVFAKQGKFGVTFDTYPDLVEEIAACGYDVYEVPHKGWEHTKAFNEQPLETTMEFKKIAPEGRREYVAGLHQENFVFVKAL